MIYTVQVLATIISISAIFASSQHIDLEIGVILTKLVIKILQYIDISIYCWNTTSRWMQICILMLRHKISIMQNCNHACERVKSPLFLIVLAYTCTSMWLLYLLYKCRWLWFLNLFHFHLQLLNKEILTQDSIVSFFR